MARRRGGTELTVVGDGPSGSPGPRPNLSGDLEELLGLRPVFSVRNRGYDRLQVDNYAAWAELELRTARLEVEHLLDRFADCSAELEISRRLLADVPRGRAAFPAGDRVNEMLRLAAEEAAALVEAGAREAERILAEARTEADARLRKAHSIKEMAVEVGDEIRTAARAERARAGEALERARHEADEMLRAAAEECSRLAEEARKEREREAAGAADRLAREDAQARRDREAAEAASAARLAAVQQEVDDLRRQRDEARQSIRQLTDRIGQALQAVVPTTPDGMVPAAREPVPG